MTDNCSLCDLYRKNFYCLTSCPMYVFLDLGDANSHPCMNRRCEPVNCCSSLRLIKFSKLNSKLNAVIKFYEKAIKKIRRMTGKEIKADNAFEFLIKLDNKIADKYSLKMPVKVKIK